MKMKALFFSDVVSHRKQASVACYNDRFTFLYVDDVRTSLETHTFTVHYGGSFTFIYVDDVHTLEKTDLWDSTACWV
jgi:hypothetical protein